MPRRKFNSKADKAETVNAKKKSEGKKSDAEIMAGFREELLGASIGRRIEALARASLDGFDPTKDVPMKDMLCSGPRRNPRKRILRSQRKSVRLNLP